MSHSLPYLRCRLYFCFILAISNISNVWPQNEFIRNCERIIPDIANGIGNGHVLRQIQYEVDLTNGLLWVRTCEILGSDYIITRGQLPKDAIVRFIQGENIEIPETTMGYAKVGENSYVVDYSTKIWMQVPPSYPHMDIGAFDYLTIDSSNDFQDAIQSMQRELKSSHSLGSERIQKIKDQISVLKTPGNAAYSFQRGTYLIAVKVENNGLISEWTVTRDGVPVRKIVNNVLTESVLQLGSIIGAPPMPVLAANDDSQDFFKGHGKTPSLGLFLVPNDKGEFVINSVASQGSANRAGLKVNDVILQVNGTEIKSMPFSEVQKLLAKDMKVDLVIRASDGSVSEKSLVKSSF